MPKLWKMCHEKLRIIGAQPCVCYCTFFRATTCIWHCWGCCLPVLSIVLIVRPLVVLLWFMQQLFTVVSAEFQILFSSKNRCTKIQIPNSKFLEASTVQSTPFDVIIIYCTYMYRTVFQRQGELRSSSTFLVVLTSQTRSKSKEKERVSQYLLCLSQKITNNHITRTVANDYRYSLVCAICA